MPSSLTPRQARARLAGYISQHPDDLNGITERKADLAFVNLETRIRDYSSLLTESQREELAELLSGGEDK